ncbi:hypothetical protein AMATHDRAFT_59484 [Amanita thiersii Skay4041]|uniref:Uncharacterized protein n=1 Tax=Amanita thiersii Skay4041 TaxID=703135 RepID=A0A2A9NM90_9AGAR|nr:hypothetical protein AMATHDRAFT_59484 [Amanita thiersii Skay4041]
MHSHASTPPLADSRYSSPALSTPHSSTPTPSNGAASTAIRHKSKSKPVNVFTNDGSFLERFQRNKKEEEEKKKQEEILHRKKYFDNRFKNRGKRPRTEDTPEPDNASPISNGTSASPVTPDVNNPVKKPKTDQSQTAKRKS